MNLHKETRLNHRTVEEALDSLVPGTRKVGVKGRAE